RRCDFRKEEIIGQSIWSQKDSRVMSYIPCGSITDIFDIETKCNDIEFIERRDILHFDSKISTQFPFRGSASFLNKRSSRLGEADSEETENNREYCNKDGSNGDDFFVQVVDRSPQFVEANFEDGVRRGTIIFIGLGCFAAFAAFYWWIITR